MLSAACQSPVIVPHFERHAAYPLLGLALLIPQDPFSIRCLSAKAFQTLLPVTTYPRPGVRKVTLVAGIKNGLEPEKSATTPFS